ncbi:tRNA uridine-5-carboxymethylaminomethyl(34) synthesis GTPase MnmE [Rhizobium sp. 32-5/1]|uniref:tRNA uridine-5-carboxymethylaminomethyl(34) synthesis GTPase MnmE n=1 Tax=Rhizobium sp. 32-5/1 TaxID=3019602 RepID=UPI00240D2AC1|nr:tRNA uridine-5-carboxymethylaminomethyl(34) synthesis GTPase MnmE [Rhizobium sp. 32-5/1]WEZ81927.1 tRNA uridine-5-carboxymethylaminomethyl(34) synthesis GTPase MnmE [Rhizobium sp. 32-5/1]
MFPRTKSEVYMDDTIYALSSGALPSGVAIVRISGPHTRDVLFRMAGEIGSNRVAHLRSIRNRNGELIDSGLVLFFPGPSSFTGEDCGELQVHGGRAVVQALLSELGSIQGLRHAEPGEFSRRAFHNGKLDLVEVEGLADLISAETEMQRRLAVEHAQGGMSAVYQGWARRLTHARAMIEAELDFADEDDVPGSVAEAIWGDMASLQIEIAEHIAGARLAEIIRDGLKVVIAGRPNAGKSSLINHLAGRDVAIVTDIAGTTRDVLSVDLSLAGFSVRLYDTAGLRETSEPIEREGIRRARSTLQDADLVLLLSDVPNGFADVTRESEHSKLIRVRTKIDQIDQIWDKADFDIAISTKTGEGIETLLSRISSYLPVLTGKISFSIPSRRRHVDCLNQAVDAIAASLIHSKTGLDIQAEYLRVAGDALGRITGRVDVEELLDVIFSEFCIGK